MPDLDKTGPQGKGSKTGRGLGICDDEKLGLGRGGRPRGGRGHGRGRSMGRRKGPDGITYYK